MYDRYFARLWKTGWFEFWLLVSLCSIHRCDKWHTNYLQISFAGFSTVSKPIWRRIRWPRPTNRAEIAWPTRTWSLKQTQKLFKSFQFRRHCIIIIKRNSSTHDENCPKPSKFATTLNKFQGKMQMAVVHAPVPFHGKNGGGACQTGPRAGSNKNMQWAKMYAQCCLCWMQHSRRIGAKSILESTCQ